MIAAARARAERERTPADFVCADAEVHAFEPASFDTIISRFGVMFFDDPVRAFANLRRAARDDARVRCIAWRSAADNPFMTTAERAAAPLLPTLPARRPDAPGQFAFANRPPGLHHPGEERMGRDRYPADRCRLHPARAGIDPVSHPARSRRPGASRRGRLELARRSSKPSAPPSIPMCTGLKSALPLPAGWSALEPLSASRAEYDRQMAMSGSALSRQTPRQR